MNGKLDIVLIGLALSSSWGNGHATTYRGLIRGLAALGHEVLFLERDVEWYRNHRDLPNPDYCTLAYYESIDELVARFGERLRRADAVVVGSYVPDGVEVIDAVAALAPNRLCFYDIDTPVTLAKLSGGKEIYLAERQIPLFDVYLSFTGGPTLRRLERSFGAQRAEAFYCSADAGVYCPANIGKRWDLGYLGTYSPDRQPTLKRLLINPARRLPQMRFVVAGPQYPKDIDWPANVELIDHLPPDAHARFYNQQRFTLNVTRADMIEAGWSPSVRLFEAAACGVPIISDYWRGLEELLPANEAVLIARSSEDVVTALTEMDEARRRDLGRAARERILSGHTGLARAKQLVTLLDQLPAASRRTTQSRLVQGVMG